MAYIDQDYYTNTFHGTTVANFDRLAEIATDIIDSMVTIPVSSLDVTCAEYAKVKKACAYIVESLDANGGVDAVNGLSSSSADSESLGDYSISASQSSSARSGIFFGDIMIPTLAYTLLTQCGLISRWVYRGTVIDDGF